MRKILVLLAIGCLLMITAGCGSHKNQGAIPVPPTEQPASSTAENWPYFSLVLPNGNVITSEDHQPTYWKGLNIQLYTQIRDPNDNSLGIVQGIVGNHTEIVSQDLQPVTLIIGPAILVQVDRTPPAASGSNTVTRECWLIAFHPDPESADRQFVYAIQAILVNVSPGDASSELLKLSKGWKLPAFQTKNSS